MIRNNKYFGIVIDNSLNWKEHNKAEVSKAIGFLRHAKASLPQEALKTLHSGIVEPHFRYCYSVWVCACATEINQLQNFSAGLLEF